MKTIAPCPLQNDALLSVYAVPGNYTDCYVTRLGRRVSLAEFMQAFYSSSLFAMERTLLKWVVRKPSSRADIRSLAEGTTDRFAAWSVEAREPDQLLLSDYRGRTRSWLRCIDVESDGAAHTDLFFGSAVVNTSQGASSIVFHALLPFHKLYSRGLLLAARRNLDE